ILRPDDRPDVVEQRIDLQPQIAVGLDPLGLGQQRLQADPHISVAAVLGPNQRPRIAPEQRQMPDDVNGKLRLGSSFRSEEHTSELQSLMRISYAVFCLK